MRTPEVHRFDYLTHDGGIFTLRLKGPRNGGYFFRLTNADMARVVDDYMTARGAPPREEREAAMDAAIARMKQANSEGISVIAIITGQLGMPLDDAVAWWNTVITEAQVELSPLRPEHIAPGALFYFGDDGIVMRVVALKRP